MSERSIFLNALDRDNPAHRAAYLDEACAGRPELRRRIERLLRAHQMEGAFLEVPAPEQLACGDVAQTFLAPSPEPGVLGRLDHYDVLEVIGRGSTGIVFKARDAKLQRLVALKVLAPRLAASRPARERFVREAQAAAAVRDDHVIAIHAVSDECALPYLVMEYIAGMTLEDRINKGGPAALPEILRIGMQVASGLAAAHAQGLIHRDIKPANILLENGVQRVKITDFGLACAAAGLTESGVLAGTPQFMAPCQTRGEPVTERSDLFSFGAVLYALCTGEPPFAGATTADVFRSVCEDSPRPIRATRPDLPEDLCDLIAKLLAKEPKDRFGSAREVGALLTGRLACAQKRLSPSPAAAVEKASPATTRPKSWRACLLAVGVMCVLIGVTTFAAVLKPWQWRASGEASRGAAPPAQPLDLRREEIPPRLLKVAGGGDPAQAPAELAAVLGDGRFLLPRVGQAAWMEASPDGALLAVPLDEDVVLFDAATGTYLRTLQGPGGRVFTVTFSCDSRLLAAVTRLEGNGGSLRVWDLSADRVLFTNPQPGPTVSCAATFSADGRRLFTECGERICVWDAQTGGLTQSVEIKPKGIASLCASPDGLRLAAANWHGNGVKLFDWDGDRLAEIPSSLRHPWPVAAAVYSPDGKFLASGDITGFKLWDAQTLKELRTVPTAAQQLAFSPDGRTLFAATTTVQPGTVHTFTRWDVGNGKELPSLAVDFSGQPNRAFHCLSRDGKVLFAVQQHSAAYVKAVNVADGTDLFNHTGHVAPLHAVAVSPDGRTVASAGDDYSVKVWDLPAGRVRFSLKVHTGAISGLAFSPDGKLLASGSGDGAIALWDVGRGTLVRALLGHSRSFSRLRFSPDGKTLAAGGEKGAVQRWDVDSGNEQAPLAGHSGPVRCVAFSPEGTRLASGGEDKTVRLDDLTGGQSRTFTTPGAVNEVAFSPDGQTLAAVSDGPAPAVRLWDLNTGAETAWQGRAGSIRGLAFSPTESLVATGAEDGTVTLWERTGSEVRSRTIDLGRFPSGIRAVAFTPDGRYLATANGNGTVYILKVGAIP